MVHRLKAIYIAKELPISRLKKALDFSEVSLTRETAVYRLDGTVLYAYSFGSIVLVDCPADREDEVFAKLAAAGMTMKEKPITEEYSVLEDPKARGFSVSSSCVAVRKLEPGMIKVVARVLAQSVALESYEDEFDRIEKRFTGLNIDLGNRGVIGLSSREVMRMIARNNMVVDEIVSGIGVLDKPESAWDSQLIDALHDRLSDEFELQERFQNLQSKMDFVQENYKVFLESLRNRYDVKLEWIIIILIAVEIILFIYDLFHM
ncbi:RMD1 family protein [Candidatus Woesearchaeota archaeon]|nr:RMD1 family protein [Candidatus Woesearchaeota archaeon]